MLSTSEAADLIATHVPRLPIAPIALRDAAGCVLQEVVHAERDQPPFDRVAMDGIAISSRSSAREFRIAGTQAAGSSPLTLGRDDDCIEIMTGAMLPKGCDAVIPVERITVQAGRARLADDVGVTPWSNLHRRAVDCRAGDEVLRPGVILGAPEIAVIASAGLVHVRANRMPRIVVISTGNELVDPGAPLAEWQIRRSNVFGVLACLRRHGYLRVADDHIGDDQTQLRERLRRHLEEADVLILSGGVSMGKFDFVPTILAELGVKTIFHKIAQRPGKPMWFGIREDKVVYALPGNPVSTFACMARYVLPGLRIACGITPTVEQVKLATDSAVLSTLATLLPVSVSNQNGQLRAEAHQTQGSGDFTALVGSDGCVELPAGAAPVPAGAIVNFYRW